MKKIPHLRLDHFNTRDLAHRFRAQLARLGFSEAGGVVEHPGGAICQFLNLAGPGYMEFIGFKKGYRHDRKTGLSFGVNGKLKNFLARVPPALKPDFHHRNYDWKMDSESNLPGWNFIRFPNTSPKEIRVWFTENEPRPGIPNRKPKGKIGVVRSLELVLNLKDEAFFRQLLSLSKLQPVQLSCGTELRFERGSRTRFASAVIAVPDLDQLQAKGLEIDLWDGRPALRARNPNPQFWDVLFIQE